MLNAIQKIRFPKDSQLEPLLTGKSTFLNQNGFLFTKFEVKGDDDLNQFCDTWNRLPRDTYLHSDSGIRERRIAKFLVTHDGRFTSVPGGYFFQSRKMNPLLGGIERRYEVSEPIFVHSPLLRSILHFDLSKIGTPEQQAWRITCHQVRILATTATPGNPTPEGLHRDGHHFVAQHLVSRQRAVGAVTEIVDCVTGKLVHRSALAQFGDSFIIDDRRMLHRVGTLFPIRPGIQGERDILIIDFVAVK